MNGTLFAQLTGQGFLPVFEKRDNWFEYDVVEAALEFERDKAGKIIALKLHQNDLIQRAVRKRNTPKVKGQPPPRLGNGIAQEGSPGTALTPPGR
ncbi:hypothetical protein BH18PSE1_BH18PSE1_04050 [soil metagenome]